MSSDARVRFQKDGKLRGSHDDEQCGGHPLAAPCDLTALMLSLETCMGHPLFWFIRDSDGTDVDEPGWLAGYLADREGGGR